MAPSTFSAFSKKIETLVSNRVNIGIIALALIVLPENDFYDLDTKIYDIQTKISYLSKDPGSATAARKVAIIGIDDETVRKSSYPDAQVPSGRKALVSRLIQRLLARNPPPKAIGIAIHFDSYLDDSAGDSLLVNAYGAATQRGVAVVQAARLTPYENGYRPKIPFRDPVWTKMRNGSLSIGYSNMIKSGNDGVIRCFNAKYSLSAHQFQTLTAWGGSALLDVFDKDLSIPSFPLAITGPSKQYGVQKIWIDFTIPCDSLFTRLSASNILHGTSPVNFESPIVLIGDMSSETADTSPTPLSTVSMPISTSVAFGPAINAELPSLMLMAYATNTMVELEEGKYRKSISFWIPSMAAFALSSFLLALIHLLKGAKVAVAAWVILPFAFFLSTCLLFTARIAYVPATRPLAAYILPFAIARILRPSKNSGVA